MERCWELTLMTLPSPFSPLPPPQEREANREMERCWDLLSASGFEAVAGYWAMSPTPVRRLRDRVAGMVKDLTADWSTNK